MIMYDENENYILHFDRLIFLRDSCWFVPFWIKGQSLPELTDGGRGRASRRLRKIKKVILYIEGSFFYFILFYLLLLVFSLPNSSGRVEQRGRDGTCSSNYASSLSSSVFSPMHRTKHDLPANVHKYFVLVIRRAGLVLVVDGGGQLFVVFPTVILRRSIYNYYLPLLKLPSSSSSFSYHCPSTLRRLRPSSLNPY